MPPDYDVSNGYWTVYSRNPVMWIVAKWSWENKLWRSVVRAPGAGTGWPVFLFFPLRPEDV